MDDKEQIKALLIFAQNDMLRMNENAKTQKQAELLINNNLDAKFHSGNIHAFEYACKHLTNILEKLEALSQPKVQQTAINLKIADSNKIKETAKIIYKTLGRGNEQHDTSIINAIEQRIIDCLSHPKEVEPKKEVDLQKLRGVEFTVRNILSLHLNNFYQENGLSVSCKSRTQAEDKIIFAILPHLQKPVESDAVEFAEWCSKNEWTYNYLRNDWFNRVMQPFKTTKELYNLFKQLKK